MKNLSFLLRWGFAAVVLLLSSLSTQAQAPTFDQAVACANSFGPRQVVVDGSGNTIAVGQFNGSVLLGNTLLTAVGATPAPGQIGLTDVFVGKLDASGAYVWAIKAGGTLNDETSGVAVDAAGDVYVTGAFESYSMSFGSGITLYNSSAAREMYVAKLSGATGQWLWARRAGGVYHDNAQAIAVNALGEVYIVGVTGGVVDFGPFTLTSTQVIGFVAKLNSMGDWQWAREAGRGQAGIGNDHSTLLF